MEMNHGEGWRRAFEAPHQQWYRVFCRRPEKSAETLEKIVKRDQTKNLTRHKKARHKREVSGACWQGTQRVVAVGACLVHVVVVMTL
jgi:hypothetical protein